MSRKEIGAGRDMDDPGRALQNETAEPCPALKAALGLIEAQPKIDDCDYVFASRAGTPFSGFGKSKAKLDKAVLAAMKSGRRRGRRSSRCPIGPFTIYAALQRP